MRLFLAIPLPDELQAAIARHAETLRASLPRATWARPGAMHLTLRFLGERESGHASAIAEALAAPVAMVPSFDLRVGRVGAFPARYRPKVIWLGVEGSDDLAFLHDRVAASLFALGEPLEDRPFHAHVTLLRCRSRYRRDDFEQIETDLEPLSGAPIPARELILFQSHLGPGGARHEAVARFPLGSS